MATVNESGNTLREVKGKSTPPINPYTESEGLEKVFKQYEKSGEEFVKFINSKLEQASKKLYDADKQRQEDLIDELTELKAKGMLQQHEDELAFIKDRAQREQQERLDTELKLIEITSKAQKDNRQREEKLIAKKQELLDAQKAAEAGDKKAEKQIKKLKTDVQKLSKDPYHFGEGFKQAFSELREQQSTNKKDVTAKTREDNIIKTLKGIGSAITQSLNQINNAISSYARYQTGINAKLEGVSKYSASSSAYSGVVGNLKNIAFSPLVNAENLYQNVSEIVSQGIATNVEQRAFFQTVKEGIVGTFDVNESYLKRMIKLQQNDSTAARMGMEAYLNRFLNMYVENTEYLHDTFDNVASSLMTASALLGESKGASASTEFEFIVQKWLGTLTGVGFGQETASALAQALGQLGSGAIDELNSSAMQNLLVMGANKAGGDLSYAELLTSGLDADKANKLIRGVVDYLQELADSGTNIVKNQLSKIFGVTTTDLIAVTNLSKAQLDQLSAETLTYSEMYGELEYQFNQLPDRLGISNILDNLFSNFVYQTGMNIGKSPAMFATWKIADLISQVTGGINIPYITAVGTGVDLETTVENLMKLAMVGVSTFTGIPGIIEGLGSVGKGSKLLTSLGVSQNNSALKILGDGFGKGDRRQSGASTSGGNIVSQYDANSYKESALNKANDESSKELEEKRKKYESQDPTVVYLKDTAKLSEQLEGYKSQFSTIIENQVKMLTALGAGEGAASGSASSVTSSVSSSQKIDYTAKLSAIEAAVSNVTSGVSPLADIFSETKLIGETLKKSSGVNAQNVGSQFSFSVQSQLTYIYGAITQFHADTIQLLDEYSPYNQAIIAGQSTAGILATPNLKITDQLLQRQSAFVQQVTSPSSSVSQFTQFTHSQQGNKNSASVANSSSANVSNYLSQISFESGFKTLVDNVQQIKNKLTSSSSPSAGVSNQSSPQGFTQYTFN